MKMRLEDAMVYVLANACRGMTTQAIAAQVYAAVCRNRSTFVKEGGRILLIM